MILTDRKYLLHFHHRFNRRRHCSSLAARSPGLFGFGSLVLYLVRVDCFPFRRLLRDLPFTNPLMVSCRDKFEFEMLFVISISS